MKNLFGKYAATAAVILAAACGALVSATAGVPPAEKSSQHAFYAFNTDEGEMNISFSEYPDGTGTVAAFITAINDDRRREVLHYVSVLDGLRETEPVGCNTPPAVHQMSARQVFRDAEYIYAWETAAAVTEYDMSKGTDTTLVRRITVGKESVDIAGYLYLLCRRPETARNVSAILDRGSVYVTDVESTIQHTVLYGKTRIFHTALTSADGRNGEIILTVTANETPMPVYFYISIDGKHIKGRIKRSATHE